MADQSQMAEPVYDGVGQHSTASLRADIGFARPVLPTEAINPLSVALDSAPVSEIVEMMASEDSRVVAAVREEKERIEQGVEIITQALGTGGRLIFVGAGTSGRLGALEAAEMPPTFGTLPQTVRAIVPGGQEEVLRYKGQSEAEDRYEDMDNQHRPFTCREGGCRCWDFSERDYSVRPWRSDPRAESGRKDDPRNVLGRLRFTDVRGRDDRASSGTRNYRGIDMLKGRHRDEDDPQHADDGFDGATGEDLRESDG